MEDKSTARLTWQVRSRIIAGVGSQSSSSWVEDAIVIIDLTRFALSNEY
jgi:hypothetical protein